MREIILLSNSPRRKELLSAIGIPFKIEINDLIEDPPSSKELPSNYAINQAINKLEKIETRDDNIYASFDTIVVIDNKILGKPKNRDDAFNMLTRLSGKYHTVITAIALKDNTKLITDYQSTNVKFYDLSNDEIESYLDTSEPYDKAGAYGIQNKGALLIEKIEGCYFNVVGLPLPKFTRMLNQFNIDLQEIIRCRIA